MLGCVNWSGLGGCRATNNGCSMVESNSNTVCTSHNHHLAFRSTLTPRDSAGCVWPVAYMKHPLQTAGYPFAGTKASKNFWRARYETVATRSLLELMHYTSVHLCRFKLGRP